MISYEPFYRSLKQRQITEYQLTKEHGVSSHTLHRMKQGKHITTKTLDTLCCALDCEVGDVVKYYGAGAQKHPPEVPGDVSLSK